MITKFRKNLRCFKSANSGAPETFLNTIWFRLPIKSVRLLTQSHRCSQQARYILIANLNSPRHPLIKYPWASTQSLMWMCFLSNCFLCSFISSHKFDRLELLRLNIHSIFPWNMHEYINLTIWICSDLWERKAVDLSRDVQECDIFFDTDVISVVQNSTTKIYRAFFFKYPNVTSNNWI